MKIDLEWRSGHILKHCMVGLYESHSNISGYAS